MFDEITISLICLTKLLLDELMVATNAEVPKGIKWTPFTKINDQS